MRTKRKFISILVCLSFLMTLLVPMTALAYTENRVSNVPTLSDDSDIDQALGTLTLKEDSDYKDDLAPGKSFTVTFPSGVKLQQSVTKVTYTTNNGEDWLPMTSGVVQSGDYTLDITLPSAFDSSTVDGIKIEPIVKIDGFDGVDIVVEVDGFDSGITSGKYVLGRVGEGDTTATVISVPTVGDESPAKGGTIRITENSVNAIGEDLQEIVVKLPTNFNWSNDMTEKTGDNYDNIQFLAGLSGSTVDDVDINGRTLTITFDPVDNRSQRGIIQIVPLFTAESSANYGEVEVSLDGDEISDADLVIAKYADYGVSISADGDVEEVFAGTIDAELTKLFFKENVNGTFVANRKTKVEFPSWVKIVGVKVSGTKNIDAADLKNAIEADIDGTDNYVEFVVPAKTTGKTEFKLAFIVSVKADASGDIVAEVSGRGGAEGEAVVGKALAPVEVTASASKELRIGLKNQAIGDIIITETKKEALKEGNLIVSLPKNVLWSGVPDVEILEGNVDIDESGIDTKDEELIIPIDGESSKPSQIKISNAYVDIDRTVAEGPVKVSIEGDALVKNDKSGEGYGGKHRLAPDRDLNDGKLNEGKPELLDAGEFDQSSVVKVEVGRVATPAPGEVQNTAVFTIGQVEYTINGVEMTMDVAPYLKNDRTYLPIRFAANVCGVADENIMWNQAEQSVVLIKGDRVVKMVIGSNTMLINGVPFVMDVAPELVDPGRTMLPVRWVAQALGCTVDWDETTQTVTIN